MRKTTYLATAMAAHERPIMTGPHSQTVDLLTNELRSLPSDELRCYKHAATERITEIETYLITPRNIYRNHAAALREDVRLLKLAVDRITDILSSRPTLRRVGNGFLA